MISPKEYSINNKTITIVASDITYETVDAVVNAARQSLLSGGGVDGAIHRAAGPDLLKACRKLGGCRTGRAKITPGFRLKAKWVIHAVGPVYRGGEDHAPGLLAKAYQSCFAIANEYSLSSIAFPAISTGHYGYPFRDATEIAVGESLRHLNAGTSLTLIKFVLYGGDFFSTYREVIEKALQEG